MVRVILLEDDSVHVLLYETICKYMYGIHVNVYGVCITCILHVS